ncbi:peptide deformylase [Sphingobacterium sp. HJSM2_6]|uniref:peptide deformylase n=1 Tax=Sphingobacterium sp. HJSM2_6 TaxID=3366264 RepID=UPI003BE3D9B7
MARFIYILLLIPTLLSAQSFEQQVQTYRKLKAEEMTKSDYGPLRKNQIPYLNYFPGNERMVVQAKVEVLMNESSFRMPTYDGTSNEYKRYALLHFHIDNQEFTLTAYQSVSLFQNPAYQNHLFVPFTDLSNGELTYDGGRYLDLSIEDITNNQLKIDFNKAYNPYCAYSNGYRCPQPLQENNLNITIDAGEKKYNGPKNERIVNKNAAKNFSSTEEKIIESADELSVMHVYLTTDEEELKTLRKPSEDIKFNDPLLAKLASRMLKTVQDPKHQGVGIAGPQVGINKNVIWVQRFDKENEPFEFYINPKIIWRSKLTRVGAEGCLSIPDQRQDVYRSFSIRLQYIDTAGNLLEENIEGFTAVIFQHEVDHLYGILFPDRLAEQSEKEWETLNEKTQLFIPKGSLRP